jgi:hypothetical protein
MGKSSLLLLPILGLISILSTLFVIEWGVQENIRIEREPISMPEEVDIHQHVKTPVCPDFGGFKLSKTPKYS